MALWDRTKRRRLLIVEDDWAILEVLKLMLEDEGHVVVTAKHGREAVALVAAGKPFDLVLMDISMPEMNGIEVARTLRADPQTADVLIGIHTGLDEHWVRERFDDYDLFLTKATDTDVLVDEIAKLFAQPEMSRARRVAATRQQTYSAEELMQARQALRTAMGLGPEVFSTQRFVAMLGDEIGQLRRIGQSDNEIATTIGTAIGRDIAPSIIERLAGDDAPSR